MKYRDYKVGFTVELPDYFNEVREASYDVFDVAEDTLKYFIILNDDGEVERSLSLNKNAEEVKTDEEYKQAVEKAISDFESLGLTKILHGEMTLESGRKVDRLIMFDKEQEENVAILFYFTRVKNSLVCSSSYVVEFYDQFETELINIFNSIEEL